MESPFLELLLVYAAEKFDEEWTHDETYKFFPICGKSDEKLGPFLS